MSKGDKQKGNREKKKPKQAKAKPAVAVESSFSRSTIQLSGKKVG
ncbi:MAG: hypothetical protein ACKVPY_07180 [Paracoccaceae bacterium]